MDKYRPCPSIIAMFTSDSQHPPRSKHAVYLGVVDIVGVAFPVSVKLQFQVQNLLPFGFKLQ